MFRRNTVFIVGAGASKELGLPVGSELSNQIAKLCSPDIDDWGRPRDEATRELLDGFEKQSKADQPTINSWLESLRDIRRALPYKDSIDAVIDQFYDRPEVAQVGKYMIAKLIMKAEAECLLRPMTDQSGAPLLRRANDSWLHTFSRMLFEGLRRDRLEEIGNNVSIVCFNYDRCIERYLTYAIAETFGCEPGEAIGFASLINIVHAYGSLGVLPQWPHGARKTVATPFGGGARDPWTVSNHLKTFSESVDSDTDETIKGLVYDAQQYVYLGFSFGRQNMELLGANSRNARVKERPAYASGLGQYEQGRDAICQLIQKTYSDDRPVVPPGVGPHPRTKLELNTTAKTLLDLHWHNILG